MNRAAGNTPRRRPRTPLRAKRYREGKKQNEDRDGIATVREVNDQRIRGNAAVAEEARSTENLCEISGNIT
jgi:hypothetical protein